jgi:hypothetical protein
LPEKLSNLVTEEQSPSSRRCKRKIISEFLKNTLDLENHKKLSDYSEVAEAIESIKWNNQNPSGSGWVGVLASIAGGLYAAPAYTTALCGYASNDKGFNRQTIYQSCSPLCQGAEGFYCLKTLDSYLLRSLCYLY